jgi:2-polyprenyl-3-methyl-5-hydroxy-6-metoxy-1,4-benzoquinol methylase
MDGPPVGACPICKSSGQLKSTTIPIAGGVIFRCMRCFGYFLYPPVCTDDHDSGWREMRRRNWDADVKNAHRFAEAIGKRAERRLGRSVRSVLEIGCGLGFLGAAFEANGYSYVGLDIDADCVEFAREKALEVYLGSVEKVAATPIVGKRFDLIVSAHVLEHVGSPYEAFEGMGSLRGSLVMITVPNAHGLSSRMKAYSGYARLVQAYTGQARQLAYMIDGYCHNFAYTRATLRYLARASGMRSIRVHGIATNDKRFGFVNVNRDLIYRAFARCTWLVGMPSGLLLVART